MTRNNAFLRTMRRGMPEGRGERNAFDQLGESSSPRLVGQWFNDWGIELCLLSQ
jgi:hypothetical protein